MSRTKGARNNSLKQAKYIKPDYDYIYLIQADSASVDVRALLQIAVRERWPVRVRGEHRPAFTATPLCWLTVQPSALVATRP
jgi:hypothetical protein